MLDLERLRADEAGAELRAVAEMPAASTACQLARRYRRSHLRGAEAAFAACANAWTASWPQAGWGGDAGFRLDRGGGLRPQQARRWRQLPGPAGLSAAVCSWAQRGRLLGTELLAGNDSTRGEEPRRLLRRVLGYLPDGHGPVAARFDSGFYRVDLLADCRARGVRFSISVPHEVLQPLVGVGALGSSRPVTAAAVVDVMQFLWVPSQLVCGAQREAGRAGAGRGSVHGEDAGVLVSRRGLGLSIESCGATASSKRASHPTLRSEAALSTRSSYGVAGIVKTVAGFEGFDVHELAFARPKHLRHAVACGV